MSGFEDWHGRVTPSRLWLKSLSNIKLCRLLGRGTSTLVRTTAQPTLALDDTHNDSPFFFLAVWELIYHKTYHMSYSQDMARGKIDHVGQNTCPTDVQSNPAWALT